MILQICVCLLEVFIIACHEEGETHSQTHVVTHSVVSEIVPALSWTPLQIEMPSYYPQVFTVTLVADNGSRPSPRRMAACFFGCRGDSYMLWNDACLFVFFSDSRHGAFKKITDSLLQLLLECMVELTMPRGAENTKLLPRSLLSAAESLSPRCSVKVSAFLLHNDLDYIERCCLKFKLFGGCDSGFYFSITIPLVALCQHINYCNCTKRKILEPRSEKSDADIYLRTV